MQPPSVDKDAAPIAPAVRRLLKARQELAEEHARRRFDAVRPETRAPEHIRREVRQTHGEREERQGLCQLRLLDGHIDGKAIDTARKALDGQEPSLVPEALIAFDEELPYLVVAFLLLIGTLRRFECHRHTVVSESVLRVEDVEVL